MKHKPVHWSEIAVYALAVLALVVYIVYRVFDLWLGLLVWTVMVVKGQR